jgi:hypothetical protein
VVLASVAGAKLSVADTIQPDRNSHQAGSDGDKTNSSPGRARHKPSSHCAGNAGLPPLNLYARVRISLCIWHTRPRVQRAPGIPCSLFVEGQCFCKTSGKSCREKAGARALKINAPPYLAVVPREGGASSIPETPVLETRSRGVLDTPHARGMTVSRNGAPKL